MDSVGLWDSKTKMWNWVLPDLPSKQYKKNTKGKNHKELLGGKSWVHRGSTSQSHSTTEHNCPLDLNQVALRLGPQNPRAQHMSTAHQQCIQHTAKLFLLLYIHIIMALAPAAAGNRGNRSRNLRDMMAPSTTNTPPRPPDLQPQHQQQQYQHKANTRHPNWLPRKS